MGHAYRIHKQDAAYFVTFTVVDWIDLFTRPEYKYFLCESLNYCIRKKSLKIFSYVMMTNHIHLLCRAEEGKLSNIVRDFKKYTTGKLISMILTGRESRREFLLEKFSHHGQQNKLNTKYQIWQNGSHAEEVFEPKFTLSKIQYIHHNPVEAGLVTYPHEYRFNSAQNYVGIRGPVDIEVLEIHKLF